MQIELARPDALYLLLLVPLWALLVWPRAGRGVPYTRGAVGGGSRRAGAGELFVLFGPRVLTGLALVSLVVGLSGPRTVETVEETVAEGRGMGLVVDLSSSMLATDMAEDRSRISVAREAAIRFARRRRYDELSLVGFGTEALTRVPPTTDQELIAQGVESLEVQLVRDGTDISGAVLTAIARLQQSDREPRVLVLLTDGAHNGTEYPPLVTARAAAALGVRIHAISVLSPNPPAPSPELAPVLARANEERETVLQGMASLTGGHYFTASSPEALDSIYGEIDRLEAPVPRSVERESRSPREAWLFLLALTLLGCEALLRGSRWGLVH